jgi:pyroglutamyl-peptidase
MGAPKILVAGFGPFAGAPNNPSGELAVRVASSRRIGPSGVRIHCTVIPTEYKEVCSTLPQLLKIEKPDAVLMFGLAGNTPFIRIETRAQNVASSVYPDVVGEKIERHSLIAGAPQMLHVRAPTQRLLHAARCSGANAELSVDAGRYICNAAFFQCLDMARQGGHPQLVTFVHIPWPRGRNRRKTGRRDLRPKMETLVRAGEAILLALISSLGTKRA